MQIRKKGDEIKKKSSPLKLLSQSQPNFAGMILGWPPYKIVSGDPDFQTKMAAKLKIEKRGDEIKKNCPLKLLSQSQPNVAEMILGWFPSKFISDFQTSDQDGRHSRT